MRTVSDPGISGRTPTGIYDRKQTERRKRNGDRSSRVHRNLAGRSRGVWTRGHVSVEQLIYSTLLDTEYHT